MYQITPYDLSQSFRLIPYGEKYVLTLWQENSLQFKSKRDAFKFISAISNFFTEILQLCEILHNSTNSYRYQIKPINKSTKDLYNIYANNDLEIIKLMRDLKYYQSDKIELYQLVKAYSFLLSYIHKNIKILSEKIKTAITDKLILIEKIRNTFEKILSNVEYYYKKNSLSIFNI